MITTLEEMLNKYATCNHYEDSGTLTAICEFFLPEICRTRSKSLYWISFARDDHFHIEFSSNTSELLGVQFELLSDSNGVKLTKFGSTRTCSDLSSAIASTAGSTFGITLLWAQLLMPDVDFRNRSGTLEHQFRDFTCSVDEDDEGPSCRCRSTDENMEIAFRTRDGCLTQCHRVVPYEKFRHVHESLQFKEARCQGNLIIETLGDPKMI